MQPDPSIRADFNEVVFKYRNKDMGSYILRRNAGRMTMRAFYITAIVALSLMLIAWRSPDKLETLPVTDDDTTIVWRPIPVAPKEEEPEPPKEEEVPVAPEKEEPGPPAGVENPMETYKEVTPEPKADVDEDNTIKSEEEKKDKQPGTEDQDGDKDGDLGQQGDENKTEGEDSTETGNGDGMSPIQDKDWTKFVEHMPECMNVNDLRRDIKYPSLLKEIGKEGKVSLQLMISKDGNVEDFRVLRADHPLFLEAVVAHIRSLSCKPGRMGDNPVRATVVIPFVFSLNR